MPIIVLTVVAHGFGLMAIHEHGLGRIRERLRRRRSATVFAAVLAPAVLVLTTLHAAEAVAWAAAYVLLGALPNVRLAMLYSLNAMTTYGHDNLGLASHWRLMGALEALNGVILFGLSTAFLFGVLQSHWPSSVREAPDPAEAPPEDAPRPKSRAR